LKNQSEIFESKLLQIIKNNNSVYDFIVDYTSQKSYGTFRIFSKKLKMLIEKLFNEKSITKEEFEKINIVIKNKEKTKNPEVIFDMDAFYKKYIEFFDINKNDDKNLLNTLFLMLPFLYIKSFKELQEIKLDSIKVYEFNKCLVIKYLNLSTNESQAVKMAKFYKEWLYLFNLAKKRNKEFLFSDSTSNYTIFNQKLNPYLCNFANKEISDTKYITLIKNALKYSKKSIFEIL